MKTTISSATLSTATISYVSEFWVTIIILTNYLFQQSKFNLLKNTLLILSSGTNEEPIRKCVQVEVLSCVNSHPPHHQTSFRCIFLLFKQQTNVFCSINTGPCKYAMKTLRRIFQLGCMKMLEQEIIQLAFICGSDFINKDICY